MTFNPVPKPNYKRRKPTRKQRNNFSKKVRDQIMDDNNCSCQICLMPATQIHHVMPRGRSGRGVYTNGLPVCNGCHTKLHQDNSLLDYWIDVYADRHGPNFYKDEWD